MKVPDSLKNMNLLVVSLLYSSASLKKSCLICMYKTVSICSLACCSNERARQFEEHELACSVTPLLFSFTEKRAALSVSINYK